MSNPQTSETPKHQIIPPEILFPFFLLASLFAAWGMANNMGDTLLAAFKRIMSMSDAETARIQIVAYFLGYGCFAIPGAMFIKRYTYKSGVLLGLGLFSFGAMLFYPAMFVNAYNSSACFAVYLLAILVLYAGLSILETSCNPYICVMGPPETATRRLNFAQSFNPIGSISGAVFAQIFILSQLKSFTPAQRTAMPPDELLQIQHGELSAIASTYACIGVVLLLFWLAIFLTKMPSRSEEDKKVDFFGTLLRLRKNRHYVWGVIAQFFYVGAQIACWSYMIRYAIVALDLEGKTPEQLRNIEPLAQLINNGLEAVNFTAMLPQSAEQAAATYYVLALIFFVSSRFLCTWLMKYFKPHIMLTVLAVLATICCILTVYVHGPFGVYSLVCISGCMSLMFPTIFGLGVHGLGDDTKIGGAGMVMAICGAALLTQMQGYVSDLFGIRNAYWVPGIAFLVVAYYGAVVCRNDDRFTEKT